MTLAQISAVALAMLWLALVVLGLLGRRGSAAVIGAIVSVAVCLPFLPRLAAYFRDVDGFLTAYGSWAMREIAISALCVTLAVCGMVTSALALRYPRGWVLPAVSTLMPVALLVWLVFRFSVF
jgi:hypothetical protein